MSSDQWFHFWMTLIQTVGGGLATLGGVSFGFLFARRSEQQQRWQEDVTFWIDELSRVHREIETVDLAETNEANAMVDRVHSELLGLLKSRPAPPVSVPDVVGLSLGAGITHGR